MSKTVCIVGAGPSGLVAAKSLLHDVPKDTFEVTIVDSQPRLGGLWPSQRSDDGGLIHPLMVANQSKHTVQFSDLAWPQDAPELPQAWQVGQYLDRYYKAYCLAAELCLETHVEKTENTHPGWRVWTRSKDGALEERSFDYLLIASGYFGKPAVPGLSVIPEHPEIPVIHSSKYRTLEALLGQDKVKGGKILVVGGQMSGVEIAGTIATHLSSATHSPGTSPILNPEKYSVHHLIRKPVWVAPTLLSPKARSLVPPFLPLDLGSYNLAHRPHPFTNTHGHITEESAICTSSRYEIALGTNQSIYSPALAITHKNNTDPQFLTVSDTYTEFVRSRLIAVSQGKLEKLSGHEATISPTQETVDDIAAVVLATGFKASDSISFLPPEVLELLSLSPGDLNNTVALGFHGTYHPYVPNLGFVGFYRSQYWGVMEMQARFVTQLWNSGGPESLTLPQGIRQALKNDTSIERTLALREDPRASQFPMGDYLWLMQEFAAALEMEREGHLSVMPTLSPAGNEMNILTPARYPSKRLNEFQQPEVTNSLKQAEATIWAGISAGKFIAKAVFRSLLGEWKLERELASKLPSHPSGHFSGTAKFFLREGTRDGREAEFDSIVENGGRIGMEYLYIEEGDFKASNGFTFRATRRYIWRYNEDKDELSVWFAKTDDQKRADYLFHKVEFIVPKDDNEKSWKATAGHMCIKDYYDVKYDFRFKAVNLLDWNLAYTVNGPNKDYTIDGTYTRQKC
ncbi:hypothetical protein QBC40DRAFT_280713 [Triangularia verruculosa]|uniref:DUF6314 domain-containing protein n=1 Tax=Triangularia verruculosa TaxID=2587418 RepID=A0AAN7AUW6_9PEZI|nr:hypothetical protein QBC40DRAFT_280713 [Triangularia verruculosa]